MSSPKRLLFLNRCFYPDVEATGQLLTELCRELEKDFEIQVVCGNPLYRKVEKRGIINKTRYGNIVIWRINNTVLPKKHFLARFINLASYFIPCCVLVFFLNKVDCVIVETDPPLLAIAAYLYSRIRRRPFLYYSQDIWPQVGLINRRMTNPLIITVLKTINGFLYSRANRIVVPGRDMKKKLEEEYLIPPHKIEVVENWADPDEIYPIRKEENTFIKKYSLENKFVVMYSGNIGLSQDLENLIYVAHSLREYNEILFVLIGEGALKEKLMNMCSSLELKNIIFLPYQEKENLKFSLSAADIHLIPLKKGMRGIIVPSKVYGIMAAGKPFIAAVDEGSEIEKIVKEFCCGLAVRPSNIGELKKAVFWAFHNRDKIEKMGQKGRKALENHYSKEICGRKIKKVIEDII